MPKVHGLRSCYDKVGRIIYFGRMLDKIRAEDRGELPAEYQPNLGKGFDAECCEFLGVDYNKVVAQVRAGKSDEEILAWCRNNGKARSERDVFVWNEFMRKRGWNDDVTPMRDKRKGQAGMRDRPDIDTMFQFIDADEGRPIR